jgi:flavin-dependent dehydrogenase
LGLQPQSEVAVALEANYPADDALQEEWSRHIALDLTGIPGGYGWVFPKGDHLNVGVGGWKYTGPNLRGHLDQLARFYGFDPARLREHRGYRLPLRRDDAPVSRGAGMLAGDAAGLVDPLSGEGIWAAFVSGRVAADSARRLLTGEAHDLSGYGAALDAEVREDILASRRLQHILQRLPGFSVLMLKYNSAFWRYLQQIIRGDLTYPDLQRKLGPLRHAMNGWADREIRHHERDLVKRAARSSN